MPAEIQPNSKAYKEQQAKDRKMEKVVQGEVKTKQSPIKKFENSMLSDDAGTVKEYLFWDVLVPRFKDLLVDLGKMTLDAIFYGDRRVPGNIERRGGSSYVRYDKPSYENGRYRYENRGDRDRRPAYNRRAAHDFDDIVLASKNDAENVLDALVESTMQYGIATVSDFYELVGMPTSYTDYRWGWYELSKAHVDRVRDGYVISLPKPRMIDDD